MLDYNPIMNSRDHVRGQYLSCFFVPVLHFFPHLTMTSVPSLNPFAPICFSSPPPTSRLCSNRSSRSASSLPPHLISPLHLVTMQIYLSPLARKTGSSESARSAAAVPANGGPMATQKNPQVKGGTKKNPSFILNLQKTTTSQNTHHEMSSYKSPLKSPSQYFQICY